MRLNTLLRRTTHEGAPAALLTEAQMLRRSVLACLLWENEFYEDGVEIVERIVALAEKRPPEEVAALAIEARQRFNLRHVPLVLTSVLAFTGRGNALVADTIVEVVQRADELTELLAVHAAVNGTTPDNVKPVLSAQMKKGLARAFERFDAYQLAKYDRAGAIRLRDVLFLVHAKPKDEAQAATWRKLVDGTLEAPDTWEVALSAGADKRETFTRLLRENKLGYLALLRNLRGMVEARVSADLMRRAIVARRGAQRVLPFRYLAAARACPQMEPALDEALCETVAVPILPGRTAVLVDVSYSMAMRLSHRSDLMRMDAAAMLGAVFPSDRRVFTFSSEVEEVPPRVGMAGVDAIIRSQGHSGTYLGKAVEFVNRRVPCDRLVVITDEQSHDAVPAPKAKRAYMINVASNANGVSRDGDWTRITGFSENVIRFITELEAGSFVDAAGA